MIWPRAPPAPRPAEAGKKGRPPVPLLIIGGYFWASFRDRAGALGDMAVLAIVVYVILGVAGASLQLAVLNPLASLHAEGGDAAKAAAEAAWTSIATGKMAYHHGVPGFTEVHPASGRAIPVSAATRWPTLRRSGCFPAEPYPPKGWPDSSADGPGNGDFSRPTEEGFKLSSGTQNGVLVTAPQEVTEKSRRPRQQVRKLWSR